jgi:hypothetical protein
MKRKSYTLIKWCARLSGIGAGATVWVFIVFFRSCNWNLDMTTGALIFYRNDPLGVLSWAILSAVLLIPFLAASATMYLVRYKNVKHTKNLTGRDIHWGATLTLVCGLVLSLFVPLEAYADWPYQSLSSEPQPQVFHFPNDWPRLCCGYVYEPHSR